MMKQKYTQAVISFIVGFIFACGLAVAGMTQPEKILGFLTLDAHWDPTLLFVMAAAVPIHMLCYFWIRGRRSPLLDQQWYLPENKSITKSLVIGSLIFGVGWGIAGYCPGPAIVSLGAGSTQAVFFVCSMIAGMFVQRMLEQRLAR